jgi:hypothetical protein
MELDKICQNCGSFFQDSKDYYTDLGVCLNDDAFEPFLDEIMENADFSDCYEMYLKKRFDGGREACDQYEEPEIIEIPDGEDINAYLYIEHMKYQNVDEIIKYFYDANNKIVNKAISTISIYVSIGNESAYEGLINYYMGLGPAESLDDVYLRIKIIDIFSSKESEKNTIDAYVNELARTPSNNTTRKLYTEILKRLSRCPSKMVQEPLLELLGKKKYSYKIKNRILEVARARETDEYWYK